MECGYTSSSLRKKSCNALRCNRCSMPVKRFAGSKWKADCEYLFFRNYIQNEQKLIQV